MFAYLQSSKKQAAEREREEPVASQSKVTQNTNGEPMLKIDEETQKRIGLKVEALAPAKLEPEMKAYGRVLDPVQLSSAVADLLSARAAAQASQAEFERQKALASDDNSSLRALQAAEAAAQRDVVAAQSGRQRLLAGWGAAVAERKDLDEFVQLLAVGDNSLVRVDLLPGQLIKTQPASAQLAALSDENNPVTAQFLGPASSVDAQTQGQGLLFLLTSRKPGFVPGAAVVGYVKIPGEQQDGVVISGKAITRYNGNAWVYLQTAGDSFTRRAVSLERPLGETWFVTEGFKPGERVVVQGARMLLSEEQKNQVRVGD